MRTCQLLCPKPKGCKLKELASLGYSLWCECAQIFFKGCFPNSQASSCTSMESRARPFLDNANESVISTVFLAWNPFHALSFANYQPHRILWAKGPTIHLVTSLRMEATLREASRQNEVLPSLLDGTLPCQRIFFFVLHHPSIGCW